MKKSSLYSAAIILCLTLGLAPFYPEPHLVGKLRWVAGGAVGMQFMDWLDLIMHGAPFLILAGLIIWDIKKSVFSPKHEEENT